MLYKIQSQLIRCNAIRLKQCINCNRSGNQYQSARYIHNVDYAEVYEKTKSLFQCKYQFEFVCLACRMRHEIDAN